MRVRGVAPDSRESTVVPAGAGKAWNASHGVCAGSGTAGVGTAAAWQQKPHTGYLGWEARRMLSRGSGTGIGNYRTRSRKCIALAAGTLARWARRARRPTYCPQPPRTGAAAIVAPSPHLGDAPGWRCGLWGAVAAGSAAAGCICVWCRRMVEPSRRAPVPPCRSLRRPRAVAAGQCCLCPCYLAGHCGAQELLRPASAACARVTWLVTAVPENRCDGPAAPVPALPCRPLRRPGAAAAGQCRAASGE
jgi:hypothetical protein